MCLWPSLHLKPNGVCGTESPRGWDFCLGGTGRGAAGLLTKKNISKDSSEILLSSKTEVSSGLCFKSLAGKVLWA